MKDKQEQWQWSVVFGGLWDPLTNNSTGGHPYLTLYFLFVNQRKLKRHCPSVSGTLFTLLGWPFQRLLVLVVLPYITFSALPSHQLPTSSLPPLFLLHPTCTLSSPFSPLKPPPMVHHQFPAFYGYSSLNTHTHTSKFKASIHI